MGPLHTANPQRMEEEEEEEHSIMVATLYTTGLERLKMSGNALPTVKELSLNTTGLLDLSKATRAGKTRKMGGF